MKTGKELERALSRLARRQRIISAVVSNRKKNSERKYNRGVITLAIAESFDNKATVKSVSDVIEEVSAKIEVEPQQIRQTLVSSSRFRRAGWGKYRLAEVPGGTLFKNLKAQLQEV